MINKKKSKIKFTLNDIFHLARLAQLKMTDREAEKYRHQLEETLDYVRNLNELNTDNVKEGLFLNLKNVFFEDGKKNQRLLNFNDVIEKKGIEKKYFKVKRIL